MKHDASQGKHWIIYHLSILWHGLRLTCKTSNVFFLTYISSLKLLLVSCKISPVLVCLVLLICLIWNYSSMKRVINDHKGFWEEKTLAEYKNSRRDLHERCRTWQSQNHCLTALYMDVFLNIPHHFPTNPKAVAALFSCKLAAARCEISNQAMCWWSPQQGHRVRQSKSLRKRFPLLGGKRLLWCSHCIIDNIGNIFQEKTHGVACLVAFLFLLYFYRLHIHELGYFSPGMVIVVARQKKIIPQSWFIFSRKGDINVF